LTEGTQQVPFLMMIAESTIRQLVEQKIEGTDRFIVSLSVQPSNSIKVFIDAVEGLDVNDCISVSRHIEGNLDREKEDFELEVSSPGLGEPFMHPLQYRKNVGRTVKVITTGGRHIEGTLTAFNDEKLTVLPDRAGNGKGKKKKPAGRKGREDAGPIELPLSEITEAKTVISFK